MLCTPIDWKKSQYQEKFLTCSFLAPLRTWLPADGCFRSRCEMNWWLEFSSCWQASTLQPLQLAASVVGMAERSRAERIGKISSTLITGCDCPACMIHILGSIPWTMQPNNQVIGPLVSLWGPGDFLILLLFTRKLLLAWFFRNSCSWLSREMKVSASARALKGSL